MPYYHDVLFPGTHCDNPGHDKFEEDGRDQGMRGRLSLNVARFGKREDLFRNLISIQTGAALGRGVAPRWRGPIIARHVD